MKILAMLGIEHGKRKATSWIPSLSNVAFILQLGKQTKADVYPVLQRKTHLLPDLDWSLFSAATNAGTGDLCFLLKYESTHELKLIRKAFRHNNCRIWNS